MAHQDDELPSLSDADLESVSGGAGMDMSSMLPIMMMMKKKQQAAAAPVQVAAPPTPAAPARPSIMVNGQPAQLDASGNLNLDDV